MRKIGVCAVLGAIGLMAASGDAFAAVVSFNCTMNSGALATEFNVTHPGGLAGTEYQISGTCNGSFEIRQDDITIDSVATATTKGQVNINGARRIKLMNIIIDGSTSTTLAAVNISAPASVSFFNSTIENSVMDGIRVTGGSLVSLDANVFGGNTIQNNAHFGVNAFGLATVMGTGPTISGNGFGGVFADLGSTVSFDGANITGNLRGGVIADDHSSVSIVGGTVDQTSALDAPAFIATRSSSVTLNGTTVTGGTSNNKNTIFAALGSSVLLREAMVTATTAFIATNQLAVITATGSSSVVLAGFNSITNNFSGGAAVILSDGSSLTEFDGARFGFTGASDTINGRGIIHTQSVIELATTSVGGGVTWTGNFLVNQASSFRADGGNVTIMGTVTLDQSANGYFNHFNGTMNNITSVVCNSTTDHVSNPTFVTPAVTIGSPPGCALF